MKARRNEILFVEEGISQISTVPNALKQQT